MWISRKSKAHIILNLIQPFAGGHSITWSTEEVILTYSLHSIDAIPLVSSQCLLLLILLFFKLSMKSFLEERSLTRRKIDEPERLLTTYTHQKRKVSLFGTSANNRFYLLPVVLTLSEWNLR